MQSKYNLYTKSISYKTRILLNNNNNNNNNNNYHCNASIPKFSKFMNH